ncbi:sigma 54-interacting transcriptional regulator [Belliella marina]|uniref:Sigma 54-interacting transcriptional regulator n=1 Tax=Belliella marina TaxID=1644146 RepID=A0ABW4VPD9_9BACT
MKSKDPVTKELLFEDLPYEVIWLDKAGKVVYANNKLCKKLGYLPSEISRLSILDINPTLNDNVWKNHWQIIENKGSAVFQTVHMDKKGKFFDVEVFSTYFEENGKKYTWGIISDTTEFTFRKNLMESTEFAANVGGWELNVHNGTLVVTNQTLKLFNTTEKDDLQPKSLVNYFAETNSVESLMKSAIEDAIPFDEILETNEVKKRYIRVVCKPVLKEAKLYKITLVFQDISEQKSREKSLRLFKEIIDKSTDLIYVFNSNGDLLHYSESVKKQLGYTDEEINNTNIYRLDPSVSHELWHTQFAEVKQKGSMILDRLITRKDLTKFPVELISYHICYNNEDYNCAIVRDVSEKKARDLELYQALEEIKTLKNRLENENEYLQEEIKSNINFDKIICKSKSYGKVLKQVVQVAPTMATVLITGESGTGKELLANAIHSNSQRKDRPLIKVNCATLPKELIESELFGHKKGAFTGAISDKAGKFTLADGGTIFLDEIGELPIELQSKLLRVIQEGEFDTLGGTKTIKVDVRIIAATNRRLEDMIKEGSFREDLYYRLNVFPIYNIPLRERKEDIPLLAQFFLEKYGTKAGKAFKRLSKKTLDLLMDYNFPGNIRELENLIERAVIIESGSILDPGIWMPKSDIKAFSEKFKTFEDLQRDHIIDVLNHTDWRVTGDKGAATILNLKGKTLFAKMKRLGIEKQVSLKI